MKKTLVSFLLATCSLAAIAQSSYTGGVQLEVKPTLSFQNDWKLNGKLGSRTLFFEGSRTQSLRGIADYERTELELILTKKTSSSITLGGGYLIRNQEGAIKHRLIQQFSVANEYTHFNLSHRLRFDETFQNDKATLYRFRYRLGLDKPLSWESGKMSFFLNNEYIPSLQNKEFELEIRLLPGIGYKVNEANEIEVGLDFRIENVLNDSHEQVYLLYLSWSPSFKN